MEPFLQQNISSSKIAKVDPLAFTIARGIYNFNNLSKLQSITEDALNLSSEELAKQNLYRVIVRGYLSLLVIMAGLIGNSINVLVLSHPKMRHLPIHCLFLGLSLSDTFFLIVFTYTVIPPILSYHELVDYTTSKFTLTLPCLYALGFIAYTMSVLFILLVTFERYMAVCHPFKVRLLRSPRSVLAASIGVAVLAFLINSGRWYEFEVIVEQSGSNESVRYIPATTNLRKNINYAKYTFINYTFVNWLLPMSTTLILNSLILRKVQLANRERRNLSQSENVENQLSKTLLVVVAVFFICNSLFFVNILAKAFKGSTAVFGVDSIRNLLWLLNSSVNFFIYCAYGKKFRKIFLEIVRRKWNWIKLMPACCHFFWNNGDGENGRDLAVFHVDLTTSSVTIESEGAPAVSLQL